ncbi:methionine--tRNA ligase [bacterium]|nr:MAG: methionine--tRNA ligase [bacterium]
MHKPFYITTPLYYVNDNPHVGHAYTTVVVDAIARYHRIAGEEVYFMTGTDEHGQKIAEAAAANNMSPKQHCDIYVKNFKKFWKDLGIEYDYFIRTTDKHHVKAVKKALQILWEAGEIYQDEYSGWYCVPCERFWMEKDLVDGNCPDCGRPVKQLAEKNYFFRMSKYQDWLIDYIGEHPEFIQPENRKNEILGFLKGQLTDLCVSRPKERLSWGIELPFDKDYVCYVWFDALLNYITGAGWPEHPDRFEHTWPADYHTIGKDIVTTHAVYWPIMLRALGIDPPKTVYSHGWWMVEATKMGKSLGNAVPIPKLIKFLGRDALRYFLLREKVMALDCQFSFESMIRRINTDLANDLGNLTSRVLGLLQQNFNGLIPEPGEATDEEKSLRDTAFAATEKVREEVWKMRLSRALEAAGELVGETNRYLERTSPWKLAKSEEYERLETVLYNAAEALRIASILYWPAMPDSCDEIRYRLGIGDKPVRLDDASEWGLLKPETQTKVGEPLFPRIDEKEMLKEFTAEEATPPEAEPAEGLIDIAQFSKVKLVLGKVKECKRVPEADKLYLLQVDMGTETRQLVAGLAQWYKPEELLGRTLVVVSNLEPAKIRGYESRGMLLAAEDKGVVRILTVDGELPPGAKVR